MMANLINKSNHVIVVKNVRYTLCIGHFPKGSRIDTPFENVRQNNSKEIIWYGEIIKPSVTGFTGAYGSSKNGVIEKITEHITNGYTAVRK